MVCILSLAVHLAFFAALIWFHDFDFLPPKPRVVRVDLVSLAPGPEIGEAMPEKVATQEPEPAKEAVSVKAKPLPEPDPEPVAAPTPVPVLKPEISLKSKPKNIKDLMAARKAKEKKAEKKKKTKLKPKAKKNPEKELEKARQALAQKVEAQNREQIDQALKRMQQAVAGQGRGLKKGPGLGAGTGRADPGPLEIYKMKIQLHVSKNWVFNETLAGMNQNLEVTVFVKILKSGEIRDISYETRSGNRYLDESAKKAIRRSNPLPELPKGMASYEVGLIFTPKGLK
ncbi:MAG: TonB family protein [Desulfobacter sp.]|nr:MAG: TonB family protein [Desulfobacter sp.]